MQRHPITGCRADSIMGLWLIEPYRFQAMYKIAINADLSQLAKEHRIKMENNPGKRSALPYELKGRTAVIEISGPTTKYETSFSDLLGGTSTIRAQASLRHAVRNPNVKNIMMHISSPGGTVAGAFDLAEEIRKTNLIKPVIGHGDDTMASASMLFGSQCRYLTANANCEVGSIGVRGGLYDTSKKLKKEGVKAISLIGGKFKGGIPGSPISEEEIKDLQRQVDEVNELFIERIHIGRGLSKQSVKDLEARVYIASKARDLGLIDKVCSFDEALATLKEGKIPASRSHGNSSNKSAASRSNAMALNAKQMKRARKFPGAADISEDDAADVLYQSCKQLSMSLKEAEEERDLFKGKYKTLKGRLPEKMDDSILNGRHEIAVSKVDLMLSSGKILSAQAEALKAALLIDKKPSQVMFAKMPNGKMPYEAIFKTFELNKPNGLLKDLSKGQPQGRQEPGDEDEEETESDKAIKQANDFANSRYKMHNGAGGNGKK